MNGPRIYGLGITRRKDNMAKYKRRDSGTNKSFKRPPIERFAIDYDVPQELANCFVGPTEQETNHRIMLFQKYLVDLLKKKRMWDRYDLMTPQGA